jgi:hypothetical protein
MSCLNRLVLFAAALAVSACGGSSSSTPKWSAGGSTALRGTLTGPSSASGTLDLSIGATYATLPPAATTAVHEPASAAATGTVNVSGSARIQGSVVTLTGTFNTDNPTAAGALSVTGTPGGYVFNGTAVGNPLSRIEGTFTRASGAGGRFSVLFVPTKAGGAVTVFCGTYSGADSGTWNLVASSDGPASGSFSASSSGSQGLLSGNVTNVTVTSGSITGGNVSLTWGPGTVATGAISGTKVGTAAGASRWDDGKGHTGTWTGSSSGC